MNFSTACATWCSPVCATFAACQNSFDGRGNYTLGLKDQLVFPEIDYTRVDKIKGMNITMTTSAKNDEQGRELLKGLGFRSAKNGWRNKWHAQQKSLSRSRSRNSRCGSATAAAAAAARE